MMLMGLDPGLASFGLALVEVPAQGLPRVRMLEIFRTEKAAKKRNLRQADDLSDRSRQIWRWLDGTCEVYRPAIIAVESCALPFGKARFSVVSALGRVRGLVDALAGHRSAAILELTPQEMKQYTAGNKSATKDEVRLALEKLYPEACAQWPRQKTLVEHAADALGAAHCALQSDFVRALRHATEDPVSDLPARL